MKKVVSIILISLLAMANISVPVHANTNIDKNELYVEIATDWNNTLDIITQKIAKKMGGEVVGFTISKDVNIDDPASEVVCNVAADAMMDLCDNQEDKTEWAELWSQAGTEAFDQVKCEIEDKFRLGNVTPKGNAICDLVSEYAALAVGAVYCETAIDYFDNVSISNSAAENEYNMLIGARYAIRGCELTVREVDLLIKDPDMSMEDFLEELVDLGLNIAAPIGVQVFEDSLTVAIEFGAAYLNSINQVELIDAYIADQSLISDEYDEFLTVVVNQYGAYEVSFTDNTVCLERYNGYLISEEDFKTVVLPTTYLGICPVVATGEYFIPSETNVEVLTVPNTIQAVGRCLIYDNDNIKIINFDSPTSGNRGTLISDCKSKFTLNLGNSVTVVPNNFINGCGITQIDIPDSVIEIGSSAFSNNALKRVEIPSSVKVIHGSAFSDNKMLTNVVMHEGIEVLYDRAFSGCPIEDFTFPSTLTSMGRLILYENNNLKTVNFNVPCDESRDVSLSARGIIHSCNSDFEVNFAKNVERIPNDFIVRCGITKITIPSSIKEIGWRAFERNQLISVDIPSSVKSIAFDAFRDNANLVEVTLHEGIEILDNSVFSGCPIKDFTFPSTLTSIGRLILCENDNLKTVNFNVPYDESRDVSLSARGIIHSCNSDFEVNFAKNVERIPNDFIVRCGITKITIPSSIKEIGWRAFERNQLISVDIPSSVKSIAFDAFRDNANLVEATLHDGIEILDDSVFSGCPIKDFTFPSTLTSIGSWILSSNDALETVYYNAVDGGTRNDGIIYGCNSDFKFNIGNDVEVIPMYTVQDCGITSVVVPSNVSKIDMHAFISNDKLASITIKNHNCKINNRYHTISENATIYGYKGSTAEDYAIENVRDFSVIVCKHNYFKVSEMLPTCSKEGEEKYECKECHHYYTVYIDKVDHSYRDWIIEYEATCENTGLKYRECGCGHIEEQEITATGHTYKKAEIAPTCVDGGYTKYYCHCGNSYLEDYINKNGHTYGNDYICDDCGFANVTLNLTPETPPTPTLTPDPSPTPTPEKATIGKVKLSTASYVYNGKIKSPKVIVKDSKGNILKKNVAYTVTTPKGRKTIGKYTYTIKFKGDFAGTKAKKLTLTIKPKTPIITAPKVAKKAITVKWNKGKKAQVTGYQVIVATNSKFTKNKKIVTVKGYNKTLKKVVKLKPKTKYFVKVRTYKTVKGVKIYSDWSKTKTTKTKA